MTSPVPLVAVIPARAGSKRIPGKNTRLLAGHPLLAYAIGAAQDSGLCPEILVVTEADPIAEVARRYGAAVHRRSPASATDQAPDWIWLEELLGQGVLRPPAIFVLLRPTSPFRTGATIRDAVAHWWMVQPVDSLRVVRVAREHAYKMWQLAPDGLRMRPVVEHVALTLVTIEDHLVDRIP